MNRAERRRAAETIQAMAAELEYWASADPARLKPGVDPESIRLAAEGRAIAERLAADRSC